MKIAILNIKIIFTQSTQAVELMSWVHWLLTNKGERLVPIDKGPGALLAKIEYDGILGNPQGLMCKKRQITYNIGTSCFVD